MEVCSEDPVALPLSSEIVVESSESVKSVFEPGTLRDRRRNIAPRPSWLEISGQFYNQGLTITPQQSCSLKTGISALSHLAHSLEAFTIQLLDDSCPKGSHAHHAHAHV
ncbi:hypothetical protein AVEN_159449-1 [Araneus ventricosus]|uniref:Uncharacterized protein n=1 Tax=Araneus ventricosus TaxID=182803 RepID=A0A4Y2A244_ARAVE|nr:hypothetical protein AVEN_159449-1 [Araneus ventricosus]